MQSPIKTIVYEGLLGDPKKVTRDDLIQKDK